MTTRYHAVGDPAGPYYEMRSQNGGNTPYEMRRRGEWLNNSYAMERMSIINPRVSSKFETKDGRSRTSSPLGNACVGSWGTRSSSWSSPQSMSLLISKLASKWRDGPISIGMYLSPEGKESVMMVGSALEKLTKSAIALKKGNFGGFLKELRPIPTQSKKQSYKKFTQGDLSGSFLAAHLGWEPLIKDAYSAATFEPNSLRSESISKSS